jgi:hypothetical protein
VEPEGCLPRDWFAEGTLSLFCSGCVEEVYTLGFLGIGDGSERTGSDGCVERWKVGGWERNGWGEARGTGAASNKVWIWLGVNDALAVRFMPSLLPFLVGSCKLGPWMPGASKE